MTGCKKIWAHYIKLSSILSTFIALFFAVFVVLLYVSFITYTKEIDDGVQGAVETALLNGVNGRLSLCRSSQYYLQYGFCTAPIPLNF